MVPTSGQPAPEDGRVVGAHVLVRQERANDDEQVWLARTSRLPPAPMTARLRGKPGRGMASPFGTEVQLGAHLQHPNLEVATEEHVVDPWICAISTDAPGVPLPQLLPAFATLRAQDELQWAAAVTHVIGSLLAGLGHAHGVTTAPGLPGGVVHGAVRPDMVSVGAGGNVRLRGFGATFEEDPSRIADRAADALAYAPPEGFGLRVRNVSLDLWGVGAVLHELLDGAPFRGDLTDVPALYRAAMAGAVAPPRHAAPEPLERMRQWLLAKQPRDRPRSCAEALAALPSAGPGAAILAALVHAQGSGASTPAAGPSMFDAFAASHSMPPQVRPSQPTPQPMAQSLPSMPPVSPPYSQPASAPYTPPASAPYSPPVAIRMPLPEDEGTVQIDEAMLAAMRAGTAPPSAGSRAPASAAHGHHAAHARAPEPMMPPPAARSSNRSAPPPSRAAEPSMIQPGMHQPAAAPGSYRPPSPAPAPGPYPPPGSYRPGPAHPASSHPGAAPARSRPDTRSSAPPPRHDPGPLDFQPTYEPTTMTVAHERRSTRNFVLVLVAAAVFATAVGVGVGYLIVGDEPVSAPPSKAPPSEAAPTKRSGSPAPPSGDGPVLQPRAP